MHITQRGDIMPRLKLLKYKKNRRTLASYKVHHNSVFSYIKRAKSSTFGRESQVKAKYYWNPYKLNIEYMKIFGPRKLSISELRSLNYVDNLYTESCKRRRRVYPISNLYKYRSMCVHH